MKNLQTGLVAALVVAGAVMYWIQHQSSEKLRTDIAALAAQNDSLKADAENLASQLAQATNSQVMGKDQLSELLKLRGEVGQLRRQTGDVTKLREENKRLQAMPVAATLQPTTPDAHEQEKMAAIQKLNDAKLGMLAFMVYAGDNNNQLPTNAAAASKYLNIDPSQIDTNFDILYIGPLNNLSAPSATIVLKEKQAWQSLSGKWMKTYGFADGHAEIHTEPNGNFDDWEAQHTVAPPSPNQ